MGNVIVIFVMLQTYSGFFYVMQCNRGKCGNYEVYIGVSKVVSSLDITTHHAALWIDKLFSLIDQCTLSVAISRETEHIKVSMYYDATFLSAI